MSESTRIIAIRHGETDWNIGGRIQGHTDIALNETGRRQVARLPAALADEGLVQVYASDLLRAWDTARAFAEPLAVPLASEPGLRERHFGIFEGLTFDAIEQDWPEQAARWRRRDADFGPDGGERLADFFARSVAVATALAARHRGETIAIVSHGGVLDCLYRAAARIELHAPRTWQMPNASINRLLHTDSGFVLVGWNDGGHLAELHG